MNGGLRSKRRAGWRDCQRTRKPACGHSSTGSSRTCRTGLRGRWNVPTRITHNEYQQQITEYARLNGWSHLHVRKSIGKGRKWATTTNVIGWPDLLLWHPLLGFAAIEVKVPPDKPTPEQLAVLAELAAAGAVTLVAYPDGWDQVEAILSRRRRSANLSHVSTSEG